MAAALFSPVRDWARGRVRAIVWLERVVSRPCTLTRATARTWCEHARACVRLREASTRARATGACILCRATVRMAACAEN